MVLPHQRRSEDHRGLRVACVIRYDYISIVPRSSIGSRSYLSSRFPSTVEGLSLGVIARIGRWGGGVELRRTTRQKRNSRIRPCDVDDER